MIVNFLFDFFVDDDPSRPYYNMADIPRERYKDPEHRLLPKNFGWWYVEVMNILNSDNNLIEHENEINVVNTLTHELKKDEINIYPLFVSDKVFQAPNVLLWLPRYVVDKVNEGVLTLLICNYFESDHVNHISMYNSYRYYLTQSGITNFEKIIVVGNSYIGEQEINKIRKQKNDLKYINGNSFEKYYLKFLNQFSVDTSAYQNHNKQKIFLMQIRTGRPWRFFTVKYLEYLGVLQSGLYSYMPFDEGDSLNNHLQDVFIGSNTPILHELKDTDVDFLKWLSSNRALDSVRLPNCMLDNMNVDATASYVDFDWIKNTYFSVICESQMNDYNGIISEKTFKMLYYGHPFIIVGSPGILGELKKIGYETFPELFDESYDAMPTSSSKIKFIAEQIAKWCDPKNLDELNRIMVRIQPKLDHNRNLLLSKDHSKFWNNFKN